jgi:hypothetical protein
MPTATKCCDGSTPSRRWRSFESASPPREVRRGFRHLPGPIRASPESLVMNAFALLEGAGSHRRLRAGSRQARTRRFIAHVKGERPTGGKHRTPRRP